MTLQPGEILNERYEIESVIAQGGMGAVYRAIDLSLDIPVAVKENLGVSESYARQFRREGTVLASLVHPNLPRVTDHFSNPKGGQYLVMDFIEGEDLREMIKRLGPLPEDLVIRVGITICDALTYLHTHVPPILHRDIKPGNIKINPEGVVFLVDFGLVKVVQGSGATTTGAQSLTPGYAPPEQYGSGTDQRSDIYSLGATLYAAVTGKIPEDGISRAMGNSRLTPISSHQRDCSPKLCAVIEKALSIEPSNRFQSAEEFKEALLELIPEPETTVKIENYEKTLKTGKSWGITPAQGKYNNTRTALIIGGALIILIAGFWITLGVFNRNSKSLSPKNTLVNTEKPSLPAILPSKPILTTAPAVTITPLPVIIPSSTVQVVIPTVLGGGRGLIAFASRVDEVPQIYLMDITGQNQQKITNLKDGACQPAWSPDGSQLVFISPCAGNDTKYPHSSLFRVNADGTGFSPLLAAPGGYYDPDWSPDGKLIAFTSLRDSAQNLTPHIYTLDIATGKINRLMTGSDLAQRRPQFSPDGSKMVFEDDRFNQPQIYLLDSRSDSGNSIPLTSATDGPAQFPYWSPDGNEIIYTQNSSSPGLMMKPINPINSKSSPVNDHTRPALNGSYSPDGDWLVFESNGDIFIMTRTGETVTHLTSSESNDFDPAWQP
jgi:eukaryotic-like serine/threonine-protein kinase